MRFTGCTLNPSCALRRNTCDRGLRGERMTKVSTARSRHARPCLKSKAIKDFEGYWLEDLIA